MCRLLGYVSDPPATVAGVLGPALGDFVQLACAKHGDGWGMARATSDGVELRRSTLAAHRDPEFDHLAHAWTADAMVVHLRWATLGLEVALENTHPFSDATMAFMHNGSVSPPEALDALTPEPLRVRRAGSTDSERLFMAVLARIHDGADPARALADAISEAAATCSYTSLNSMLLTPDALHVVSLYDPEAIMADAGPDYYELRYTSTSCGVMVASSGFPQPGWQLMENGEMLVVDRHTHAVSSFELAGRPVRPGPTKGAISG